MTVRNHSGLLFSFEQVLQELQDLEGWTRSCLDARGPLRIKQLREDLRSVQESRRAGVVLVDKPRAIATVQTRAWERNEGGLPKIGKLWFQMTVVPVQEKRVRSFEIGDDTNFHLQIVDPETGEIDSEWHFDIVSSDGPGSILHTQFRHNMIDKPIPIPRLPSLVMLPSDALEFLLSELFHSKWSEVGQGKDYEAFSRKQQPRVRGFLEWQRRQLTGGGSVWSMLRQARLDGATDFSSGR